MKGAWVIGCLALLAAPAVLAQQTYKWVDENGVVHYGDAIPADAAKRERQVLNRQGISVDTLEAEKTPEQLAAEARQRELDRMEREALRDREIHDRMLLDTYLSVRDIERVRDSRLDSLTSQITVTNHYVEILADRLQKLENEAADYLPFNETSTEPLPQDLANDLMDTTHRLNELYASRDAIETEQQRVREQFALEITRFQELKAARRH